MLKVFAVPRIELAMKAGMPYLLAQYFDIFNELFMVCYNKHHIFYPFSSVSSTVPVFIPVLVVVWPAADVESINTVQE